jgi:hypothetical protein
MTAILMACGLTLGVFLRAESGKAQVPPTGSPGGEPVAESIRSVTAPATAAPAASPSEVLFAAEPLDAHVFRAGVDLGSTPLTLEVPRGQRIRLEVRRPGFVNRVVELDGAEKRMTLKLVPNSAARIARPDRTRR